MLDKLKALNLFWVIDPKTKEISVSLTLMMITFICTIIGCALEMAEVVKSTSNLTELFYATVALYFGRRFSAKGQTFGSDAPTNTEKTQ